MTAVPVTPNSFADQYLPPKTKNTASTPSTDFARVLDDVSNQSTQTAAPKPTRSDADKSVARRDDKASNNVAADRATEKADRADRAADKADRAADNTTDNAADKPADTAAGKKTSKDQKTQKDDKAKGKAAKTDKVAAKTEGNQATGDTKALTADMKTAAVVIDAGAPTVAATLATAAPTAVPTDAAALAVATGVAQTAVSAATTPATTTGAIKGPAALAAGAAASTTQAISTAAAAIAGAATTPGTTDPNAVATSAALTTNDNAGSAVVADPTANGATSTHDTDTSTAPSTNANANATPDAALAGTNLDARTAELLSALTPVTSGETLATKLDTKSTSSAIDAAAAKAVMDTVATAPRTVDPTQNAAIATKFVTNTMNTEPYRQVVSVVAPLKHMADGDYTMTLKLHPAHLGAVEITVALQGGQVNLSMNSDNPASRQMLRDSMNDLRTSLQQSGLTAGSMDVGSNNSQQHGQSNGASNQRAGSNYGPSTEDDAPLARFDVEVPTTAVADGRLDARV